MPEVVISAWQQIWAMSATTDSSTLISSQSSESSVPSSPSTTAANSPRTVSPRSSALSGGIKLSSSVLLSHFKKSSDKPKTKRDAASHMEDGDNAQLNTGLIR